MPDHDTVRLARIDADLRAPDDQGAAQIAAKISFKRTGNARKSEWMDARYRLEAHTLACFSEEIK
jgi:hypothetical protein